MCEGVDRGGGGTGVEGAESGVEGAESGVEGAGSGGRGGGKRGRGAWKDWGGKLIFYRKFKENGSFMPISYIKVHQEKYAYLCGLFCHTTHVMYGASRISA